MHKYKKGPLHKQMACKSNFDHVMSMQNTHAYHVLNFFQAQYSSQLRKKWCMSLKNRSQFLVEYQTVRSLSWSAVKLYCTGKKKWIWEQLVAWLFSLHRSFSCLLEENFFMISFTSISFNSSCLILNRVR